MSLWHSYGKIYALGHRALRHLTDSEVLVEKKIDRSQFSFGLFECEEKDELMKWAWPHISRMATRGFPQWYKEQLLKRQFEEEGTQ